MNKVNLYVMIGKESEKLQGVQVSIMIFFS